MADLTKLLADHFPLPNQEDKITWKGKEEYSARVLQQLLYMSMEAEVDNVVCSVWMNLVPPKVEVFMWLTLLGRLNTKERLHRKGVLSANQVACTFCSVQPESLDHVLLQCHISWKVWGSIAEDLGLELIMHPTFKQFYNACLAIQWKRKNMKRIWISTVFAVTWRLWMVRNEVIFQQKEMNITEICHSIKWRVAEWTKAWKDQLPYRVEELARNFSAIPTLLN